MKTALITGASSGIGEKFARELARQSMDLVLVARRQEKLEQLAKALMGEYPITVETIAQDLADPRAGQIVEECLAAREIAVDLLVNNAGFGDYGAFCDRDLNRQLEMIQLNITALVELTHRFLRPMRDRGSGSIINVASIAAFQPLPYFSVYAASKAFVLSFSEALWAENRERGIEILAVCPGPTESDFFKIAQFPNSKKSQDELFPAEKVVEAALIALENGQSNIVTGEMGNQLIANLPRFLPREIVVSLVEKQFKA